MGEAAKLGCRVHPNLKRATLDRSHQLELAACIIMHAPSLSQVLINTRQRDQLLDSIARVGLFDPIDAHIREAKMGLETPLQGYSGTNHINSTYR
ncbi:unnamed protein product [Linum trigynum]|uniref:Uncharacterized protein n=1 Tax=Linum trigynum TaxID=586398 RepID=A0AAV2FVC9_9ROSI